MLNVGDAHEFVYIIPEDKTVPHLYPEADEFQEIPEVFATGFMVGLMEWTCIQHLNPSLDETQMSLGIDIQTTHSAASTPGMTVTVSVHVEAVTGKTVTWHVVARDNRDVIGEGTHTRAIVDRARFLAGVRRKAHDIGLPETS